MKAIALLIGLLALLLSSPAFARAPTLEELPTVKKLQELADKAIDERRRAEEAAARDPVMEGIAAYRAGAPSAPAWRAIADILKDDKETQEHREAAAAAFKERFKTPGSGDQRIEEAKRNIGYYLLNDLNSRDRQVRIWVHSIYRTFWKGTADRIRYNPEEDNPRKRHDSYKLWREFFRGR